MGFKEDADFARFVAMGAVGAAVAADVLRERYGHEPIELERYAMANKVWQSKVKRLRLPDAPLSSVWSGGGCEGCFSCAFVSPHSADDAVGEVAFVGSAGFASGLAL